MIKFDSISLTFNQRELLKDFNFTIIPGEKWLIQGPSGSGKSSLLGMILGFVQPDQGVITLGDLPVNRRTIWEVRQQLSFVGQEIPTVNGTAMDFINRIFSYRCNSEIAPGTEEIYKLGQHFGFSQDMFQQKMEKLSGGEKQRVALIISILLKRPIFLLDEVTSALDDELKSVVVEYFSNVPETVVCISHDRDWRSSNSIRKLDLLQV